MAFMAPAGGCALRMYRQGLGDCFLLAFADAEGGQKRLLIDCGVLLGAREAKDRIRAVANDILESTGGRLDVLAITHEHWDHVSGFVQAQREFDQMEVGQVWLAWTEDPDDPLARTLRERRDLALRALIQERFRAGSRTSRSDTAGFAARIETVMGFFGVAAGPLAAARTGEALAWVKARWPNPIYLRPGGEPVTIPGLERPRFFILGPPPDAKSIHQGDPAKGSGEVYLDDPGQGRLGFHLDALAVGAEREQCPPPFNPAYQRWSADPDWKHLPQDLYRSEPWRTIESDHLDAAGRLALMLDNHTNNTSLAMAIELTPGGAVLLFPGDAQRGNWSSWETVRWTGAGAGTTTQDLLGRTVLYKVGHHGSHNATARSAGLELMNHPRLAALIPVDRETAAQKHWQMPYPPLLKRLLERTGGRLLLSDRGWEGDPAAPEVAEFANRCRETELYFEVAFPPGA